MAQETKLETISFTLDNKVSRVFLNRPEIHNAFNEVMIKELLELFQQLSKNKDVRVMVLSGRGKSFCSGADLSWMKKQKDYTWEENYEDAVQLAELFYQLYSLPFPTIAKVNGAAIAGGMGLVTSCDIAIASEEAKFSLSEVKIGLVPACICPYILKRVGESCCRELFLTGERFSANRALKIGLVNQVVSAEELDEVTDALVKKMLSGGPAALAACKELISTTSQIDLQEAKSFTARMIANLRVSSEGQEGIRAFFEKRKPTWINKKSD